MESKLGNCTISMIRKVRDFSILHDIVDFHAQMGYGSFQIRREKQL
jgi:hypothetical protein